MMAWNNRRCPRVHRLALLFWLIVVAGTASAWHPLEPLETSSPRATMATFLDVTDEVASRYLVYVSSPSRETFKAAWSLRPKYTGLFDLSNVPPASRAKVGAETFLLLWDVLARVELPPLEEIPDAAAVATDEAKDGPALRWRIPGTEIAIVRIEQGPRTGEFLFSARSNGRRSSTSWRRDSPTCARCRLRISTRRADGSPGG
jgi:MscS family membrane protein